MNQVYKHMKLILVCMFFMITSLCSYSKGQDNNNRVYYPSVRASISFGPQYITNEVTSGTRWSTVSNLDLGLVFPNKNNKFQYGVDIGTGSAWDADFNSVNDPNNTSVSILHVHNSASIDLIPFISYKIEDIRFELASGASLSWVKWLNSTQYATSSERISPIIRVKIIKRIANGLGVFLSVTKKFNTYGKLSCGGDNFNCFNDSGFVGSLSAEIGLSYIF